MSIQTSERAITVRSEFLSTIQRRIALATVLMPFLGSLFAAWLAWVSGGIGALEVWLLITMYTLSILGITLGFHRHFAHRSFSAKPFVRAALGILGSMAAQGPLIHWASNHRRHHGHSDHQGDPHSPHLSGAGLLGQIRGFWHAHLGWLWSGEITNSAQFAQDLLRDRSVFKISRLYLLWVALGIAIPAVVGGAVSGSWKGALGGFLWGGLVRIFLCHHMTWSVNSVTHMYGSRVFETPDESRNNPWLVLPTLGEGWHNNHHAFPASAIFGLQRFQIDPGGWLILALERMRWVYDVRVAPSSGAGGKGEH